MTNKLKVLIGYYSRSGNTKKMASLIAKGVEKEGVETVVQDVRRVKLSELLKYHGIIIGSPTYYGMMSAEVKKLFDDSVRVHGRLTGKVGGAFTSSGGTACGAETTILSILKAILIHGMIVQGDAGDNHYGPAALGAPDKKTAVICEIYGHKIARLVKKVFV
jgi:NAD(P)H dehydrogenase (quinone)